MSSRKTNKSNQRSKTGKSAIVSAKQNNNRLVALVVLLFMTVVGAFVVWRLNAATTNFEAESGSKSATGVTTGSDATASGGQYVKFNAVTSTTTTSGGAFPGDPRPYGPKAYWGANQPGDADPYAKHEAPIGKPISLRHTFKQWGDINSGGIQNTAKGDISKGRLPLINIKAGDVGWSNVASGSKNADIDKLLGQLDNLGGPVWLIFHHEPENDINGSTNTIESWKGMQIKVRERMRAYNGGKGTKNIALMPNFMAITFIKNNGTEIDKWWPGYGVWDVLMISAYCMTPCRNSGQINTTQPQWPAFVKFAESKNLPMGVAEWSVQNTTEGVYAMNEMWEYGFRNKKPLVGYAYFDSDGNRPAGEEGTPLTYLRELTMAKFTDISKNDSRVMRISELKNTTASTTTYGSVTASVSVPENGTYKLWARIKAPNSTANAVQVQIGTSGTFKMGDAAIPAAQWQWVDYVNGNTASKASLQLAAGTYQLKVTGLEDGVQFDKLMITNESCVPANTSFGQECTIVKDTTPPTATITSPQEGQTVSGTVTVAVSASDNVGVANVNFRLGDEWKVSDVDSPYSWTWNTTEVANGTYVITVRVRDAAENLTEKKVNVVVANGAPAPTSTTAPPGTK